MICSFGYLKQIFNKSYIRTWMTMPQVMMEATMAMKKVALASIFEKSS